ncbi:DEAD/DEAH box helicase [Loktanella sp. SALINAS62]|uniref:DEAD/DEAH box helicase n=1 Tax=Loktanella sp. SALINAS62 TaxID=2706124 RepID=UPI001B8CC8D5|nr:DEAD/DEAH box helicase [Loktanella sp. SALINAS62]MBS1304191.1 DEAD/DEAH box helicase [Loktanella sp. SALINAS62]
MTKFSDLNLDAKVLKAIADTGYETPTPIQAGAIPPALEGRDVLGIAQTGTGKTASFTLPMITLLGRGRARARMPRSLVLAPTRELAAQVAENFDAYAKYTKLTKALLIGGTSFKDQDKLIDKGVDVLIATPGRLLDHLERGKLILTDVKIMVVDEADRMLDMGFIPDIEEIFKRTPFTRQTLFFSATMAPEIERITNTFLSNPAKIEVARAATTGENIKQGVVMFQGSNRTRADAEKRDLLRRLITAEGDACSNAIIFCNRKSDVDMVAKSLKKHGYDAEPIHGDLDQSHRTRTLDGFRDGKIRFLVASDVAARGLDIPAVTHVFNFDVPSHAEDYVHRIGRTGRAGRSGVAIMICNPRDTKNLEDVERLVQREIPRLDNPMGTAPADEAAQTGSDAPQPAAKSADDKPKRTRSRSRKPKPDADAPTAAPNANAEPAAATQEAVETAKDIAQPAAADTPPQPQPAADTSAQGERPQRGGRGRGRGGAPDTQSGNDRQGNDRQSHPRQGQDRQSRSNDNVVGMGDDMPEFIAKSFAERGSA